MAGETCFATTKERFEVREYLIGNEMSHESLRQWRHLQRAIVRTLFSRIIANIANSELLETPLAAKVAIHRLMLMIYKFLLTISDVILGQVHARCYPRMIQCFGSGRSSIRINC
jgi:hypothetical protein